jgi:phosphohistidine phosphatase
MILAAAGWSNKDGAVVVVGHQPTLGEVAALLISDNPGGLSVKKGAVWWFSCKKTQSAKKIALRTVISPDML